MKKLSLLVLAIFLFLSLFACNSENDASSNYTNSSVKRDDSETTVTDNSVGTQHNHTFKEWIVKEEATCKKEGLKTRACAVCGETETKSIEKIDHKYNNVRITAPTCDKEGVKTYTCINCDNTKTESIEKYEHKYDDGKITTAATCIEDGAKTYTCSGCGNTKTISTGKGDHEYDKGKITTVATCTKDGVKTYTCKNCSNTKTESVEKVAHEYDKGKITTAATCTKEGVKTYTCKDCTGTKTESIEKTAHKYDNGKITTSSTCIKDGIKTYTCMDCGNTKTENIGKGEHKYDDGKITTSATCSKEGVKTYTCTICKNTKTSSIPKAEHSFGSATCTEAKKCNNCGATGGNALGHSYSSGFCTRCGEKDPNYVKIYSVGEVLRIEGEFEFKINSVTRHTVCSDKYDKISATTAVIIDYTFKNLGSSKLIIDEWDFEVYDGTGVEGDSLYFGIYCDHGIEAKYCLTGGTCNAKLPVALLNDGDYITVILKIGYKPVATFKVSVGGDVSGTMLEPWDYSSASSLDKNAAEALEASTNATIFDAAGLTSSVSASLTLIKNRLNDMAELVESREEIASPISGYSSLKELIDDTYDYCSATYTYNFRSRSTTLDWKLVNIMKASKELFESFGGTTHYN